MSDVIRIVSLAFAIIVFAPAISKAATGFKHSGLASEALYQHILPAYKKLEHHAAAVEASVQKLCTVATQRNLIETRDQFTHLVAAWSAIEHIRFGPVARDNRHERILFWPDRKGIGRRQVQRHLRLQTKSVVDPQTLRKKSVAVQGLAAMEELLFGTGADGLTTSNPTSRFRCRYAYAVSRNLRLIVVAISMEWSNSKTGFAAHWLAPGRTNPIYQRDEEVTHQLVQAFINGLSTVRDLKLLKPLGYLRNKTRRDTFRKPSKPPFSRSALSLVVLKNNVGGLLGLLQNSGLAARLDVVNPGIIASVVTELAFVIKQFERVEAKGAIAFRQNDARQVLVAAGFPLKNARIVGGDALAKATGLAIGFTASDGD